MHNGANPGRNILDIPGRAEISIVVNGFKKVLKKQDFFQTCPAGQADEIFVKKSRFAR